MLTTIVLVGSLLHGSITVDAADTVSDSFADFPYRIWDSADQILIISDEPFILKNLSDIDSDLFSRNGVLELELNNSSFRYGLFTPSSNSYELTYTDDTGWSTSATPYVNLWGERYYLGVLMQRDSDSSIYVSPAISGFGSGGDIPTLPGVVDVEELIKNQINNQSAAGAAATQIINNTTIQYNSYQAGDISSAEMQQNVTDNINSLNELTPSTLLDAIQINNGLTYNQSIQDQLLNTASPDLLTEISSYINQAQNLFNAYRRGDIDQQTLMNTLSNTNRYIARKSYEGGYTSTADLELINMAINTINNYIEQAASLKDISQDSSDKSQQSDQAELDYLDELTAETTATVEQIAPSKNFTSGQTGEAQEVLDLIWENEFVKRLLPMCAGFMVVCVVLGIRYKV